MPENTVIRHCIDQLNAGNMEIRGELIDFAYARLQRMTKKMKGDFERLGRWEQTDDILQNASLRLFDSLRSVTLADERHFYRLAALQIRREMVDLCRHYQGPLGVGANHHTQRRQANAEKSAAPPAYDQAEVSADPRRMHEWGEFHRCVGELPEKEREVFEMLWYHELSQQEVAELTGLSTRQIKRIWRSAKLQLHDRLQGDVPSS